MQIILIECQGGDEPIGAAIDYPRAIDLLIGFNWLNENTEVWDDRGIGRSLKEILGEDWIDDLRDKWTMKDFNEYFDGDFFLKTLDVFE